MLRERKRKIIVYMVLFHFIVFLNYKFDLKIMVLNI